MKGIPADKAFYMKTGTFTASRTGKLFSGNTNTQTAHHQE